MIPPPSGGGIRSSSPRGGQDDRGITARHSADGVQGTGTAPAAGGDVAVALSGAGARPGGVAVADARVRGEEPPPWDGPPPWEGGDDSGVSVGTVVSATATEQVDGAAVPDLNQIVERWGEVADRLRAAERAMLAALVAGTPPVVVTASGALKLEADDETAAEGLEAGREHLLEAVRASFPAIRRINIRHSGVAAAGERLTIEGIRAERMARLRARDPLLARAMDELDLELLD